jgi:heat shock protein HtpX
MRTWNYLKTGILMVVLAGLFLLVGHLLGGVQGASIALILALGMNALIYWNGEKWALSLAQARPLSRSEAPWIYEATEQISRRAGIPLPRLYLSPDPQPNAFACGRGPGSAAVCLTEGLLHSLSREEVAGVIAHEIAHIRNRDTLIMTVTAAIATAITYLAYLALFLGDRNRNPLVGLLIFLFAPLAATLIQLAVSRSREYAADAAGAQFLGNPHPLADALERLEMETKGFPSEVAAPSMAHLYIANPLSMEGINTLFATHPPIRERVRRLRAMARG